MTYSKINFERCEIMTEKITEKRLQEWFRQFRLQYFSGKLAKWKVQIGADIDPRVVGESGSCENEVKTIYLFERALFSKEMAKDILLHEMCHAAVGPWHGKKFEVEMKRLRSEGAPVAEWEFNEPLPVSSDLIRISVDEALSKGLTLKDAQEWVADEYLATTRAELLKRYPRASQGSDPAK